MFTRMSVLALCTALALLASTGQAALTLNGTLTSGNGSALGTLPPSLDFSLSLDFDESNTSFSVVNSGLFSSTVANIQISGGDIIVLENGANDQALFALDTVGPSGSISVNFIGDAITTDAVTLENLLSLINAGAPATISVNFGAAGNYTGNVVSAVPEPSSVLLVAAAAAMATCLRRKRVARPA